ncbi:hypothetical protein OIU85_021146 [Salix viminalis]|uniref:Uncharacterized protein n=1 Tax=Salix viminalis TaxID=40686 RepID=A0A9Q0ZDA6_SALVM|nr:hypothetical protein OIU85_021146 [Salix viminalis]
MASLWRSKEVMGRSKPDALLLHGVPPLMQWIAPLPLLRHPIRLLLHVLIHLQRIVINILLKGKDPLPSFFNGRSVFLSKSRSMALVSVRGNKDSHEKKKGGLWSKFLRRPRDKKVEEGLVHSRSTRERIIITS